MTTAAFVISCVALTVSLLGALLALLTYRRAGSRVKVLVHMDHSWGTQQPPTTVVRVVAANTGLAAVQMQSPLWKVRGTRGYLSLKAEEMKGTHAETRTVLGLHVQPWTFPLSALGPLGFGARPVSARAIVETADGKRVSSRPIKLAPSDWDRWSVTSS